MQAARQAADPGIAYTDLLRRQHPLLQPLPQPLLALPPADSKPLVRQAGAWLQSPQTLLDRRQQQQQQQQHQSAGRALLKLSLAEPEKREHVPLPLPLISIPMPWGAPVSASELRLPLLPEVVLQSALCASDSQLKSQLQSTQVQCPGACAFCFRIL